MPDGWDAIIAEAEQTPAAQDSWDAIALDAEAEEQARQQAQKDLDNAEAYRRFAERAPRYSAALTRAGYPIQEGEDAAAHALRSLSEEKARDEASWLNASVRSTASSLWNDLGAAGAALAAPLSSAAREDAKNFAALNELNEMVRSEIDPGTFSRMASNAARSGGQMLGAALTTKGLGALGAGTRAATTAGIGSMGAYTVGPSLLEAERAKLTPGQTVAHVGGRLATEIIPERLAPGVLGGIGAGGATWQGRLGRRLVEEPAADIASLQAGAALDPLTLGTPYEAPTLAENLETAGTSLLAAAPLGAVATFQDARQSIAAAQAQKEAQQRAELAASLRARGIDPDRMDVEATYRGFDTPAATPETQAADAAQIAHAALFQDPQAEIGALQEPTPEALAADEQASGLMGRVPLRADTPTADVPTPPTWPADEIPTAPQVDPAIANILDTWGHPREALRDGGFVTAQHQRDDAVADEINETPTVVVPPVGDVEAQFTDGQTTQFAAPLTLDPQFATETTGAEVPIANLREVGAPGSPERTAARRAAVAERMRDAPERARIEKGAEPAELLGTGEMPPVAPQTAPIPPAVRTARWNAKRAESAERRLAEAEKRLVEVERRFKRAQTNADKRIDTTSQAKARERMAPLVKEREVMQGRVAKLREAATQARAAAPARIPNELQPDVPPIQSAPARAPKAPSIPTTRPEALAETPSPTTRKEPRALRKEEGQGQALLREPAPAAELPPRLEPVFEEGKPSIPPAAKAEPSEDRKRIVAALAPYIGKNAKVTHFSDGRTRIVPEGSSRPIVLEEAPFDETTPSAWFDSVAAHGTPALKSVFRKIGKEKAFGNVVKLAESGNMPEAKDAFLKKSKKDLDEVFKLAPPAAALIETPGEGGIGFQSVIRLNSALRDTAEWKRMPVHAREEIIHRLWRIMPEDMRRGVLDKAPQNRREGFRKRGVKTTDTAAMELGTQVLLRHLDAREIRGKEAQEPGVFGRILTWLGNLARKAFGISRASAQQGRPLIDRAAEAVESGELWKRDRADVKSEVDAGDAYSVGAPFIQRVRDELSPDDNRQTTEEWDRKAQEIIESNRAEVGRIRERALRGLPLDAVEQRVLAFTATRSMADALQSIDPRTQVEKTARALRDYAAEDRAGTTAGQALRARRLDLSESEGRQMAVYKALGEIGPKWQKRLDQAMDDEVRDRIYRDMAEARIRMLKKAEKVAREKYGIKLDFNDPLWAEKLRPMDAAYAVAAVEDVRMEEGDTRDFQLGMLLAELQAKNLLSVSSAFVNAVGYPLMAGMHAAQSVVGRPLVAAFKGDKDAARGALLASKAILRTLFSKAALSRASKQAVQEWKTGKPINLDPSSSTYRDMGSQMQSLGRKAGMSEKAAAVARTILGPAQELMAFTDTFMWEMRYQTALAEEAAKRTNGDAEAMAHLMDEPDVAMQERAAFDANFFTFREASQNRAADQVFRAVNILRHPTFGLKPDDAGGAGRWIYNPINSLVPFFKMIWNGGVMSARLAAPVFDAALSAKRIHEAIKAKKEGREDAEAEQTFKAARSLTYSMVGAALWASVLAYGDDEDEEVRPRITAPQGNLPTAERLTREPVEQPNSVNLPGVGRVPLSLGEPYGLALAAIQAGRKEKAFGDVGERLVQSFLSRQFLEGIDSLQRDAYDEQGRKIGVLEKGASGLVQNILPGQQLIKETNKLGEDTSKAYVNAPPTLANVAKRAYGLGREEQASPYGEAPTKERGRLASRLLRESGQYQGAAEELATAITRANAAIQAKVDEAEARGADLTEVKKLRDTKWFPARVQSASEQLGVLTPDERRVLDRMTGEEWLKIVDRAKSTLDKLEAKPERYLALLSDLRQTAARVARSKMLKERAKTPAP